MIDSGVSRGGGAQASLTSPLGIPNDVVIQNQKNLHSFAMAYLDCFLKSVSSCQHAAVFHEIRTKMMVLATYLLLQH